MGLDMYLTGELFVGEEYKHIGVKKEIKITKEQNGQGVEIAIPTEVEAPLSSMIFKLGYWRKANHIHKWFVENVQKGEDDCRSYYVDGTVLEKLLNDCKAIYETKDLTLAEKTLPTQSGFFFGTTSYDEYYYSDIEETIKIIENALQLQEKYTLDIYYRASW